MSMFLCWRWWGITFWPSPLRWRQERSETMDKRATEEGEEEEEEEGSALAKPVWGRVFRSCCAAPNKRIRWEGRHCGHFCKKISKKIIFFLTTVTISNLPVSACNKGLWIGIRSRTVLPLKRLMKKLVQLFCREKGSWRSCLKFLVPILKVPSFQSASFVDHVISATTTSSKVNKDKRVRMAKYLLLQVYMKVGLCCFINIRFTFWI